MKSVATIVAADRHALAMILTACIVIVSPVVATAAGDDGEDNQATTDPIAALLRSLEPLNSVEVRYEFAQTVSSTMAVRSGNNTAETRPPYSMTVIFRQDRDRAFLSTFTASKRRQRDQVLADDELVTFWGNTDLEGGLRNDLEFGIHITSERLAGSAHRASLTKLLDAVNKHGAVPLGWLACHPIASYLADDSKASNSTDGALIAVESESPYGDLKMWLDPLHGHLPQKILLTKRGSDFADERRVDEIELQGDGKIWPDGGVAEIVVSAENIVVDRRNDIPYIKRVIVNTKTVSEAGPVVTTTTDARVQEINFQPSFADEDFTTNLRIPEGTTVTVNGASHLPYVWNGEQVVASVSGLKPVSVAGKKYRLLLLFLLNVLAFVMIGIVYLVRRRRRSQS